MFQCIVRGVQKDAADRRNSDAAHQKDCRMRGFVMQPQVAAGTFEFDYRVERQKRELTLICGVPQSRNHHEKVLVRGAGDGKPSRISLLIGFAGIQQGDINPLSRAEGESWRLFELQGHRPLRHEETLLQFD